MADNNDSVTEYMKNYGELVLKSEQTSAQSHINQRIDIHVKPYWAKLLMCKCKNKSRFNIELLLTVSQSQYVGEPHRPNVEITNNNLFVEDTSRVHCTKCDHVGSYREFVERYEATHKPRK